MLHAVGSRHVEGGERAVIDHASGRQSVPGLEGPQCALQSRIEEPGIGGAGQACEVSTDPQAFAKCGDDRGALPRLQRGSVGQWWPAAGRGERLKSRQGVTQANGVGPLRIAG